MSGAGHVEEGAFDVAIVGYGPVGGLLAMELAAAGRTVVVLERSTELCELPRAIGLDGESMRAFQRLGHATAVDGLLQPPRAENRFCFTDSTRRPLFGLDIPDRGHHGWRDVAFFDQPELERWMRSEIATLPTVDVRLGQEVVGLAPHADRVVLETRGPDGPRRVEAAFVVGCDGASSAVRGWIGSRWESLGYDQDWLVLDIEQHAEADLPITMMQVCDPARLTTYIPCRDPYRRWEFQLVPGDDPETIGTPESIERLLAPWCPPEHYTIRRSAVYQFHAATASSWREGRVLLAGDAAHQTPPFLGQGLNSGFRDAVSLGWRLPLVLDGTSGPGLLDDYPLERGVHSRDLVDRAVGIGMLMETLAAREAGLPDPHADVEQRAALPDGPQVPALRGGTLLEAQVGERGRAGRILAQPDVRDARGRVCRFDDLLGPGFAIVGRTKADLALGTEAAEIAARLGARLVALDTLEGVEGAHDAVFDAHPSAVIRPDRHVYGAAAPDTPLDAVVGQLGRSLRLS